MRVVGRELLDAFCKKHADAKSWIEAWLAEVEAASWKASMEVKARYASASFLSEPNNTVIFNVKGNHYRLEVIVSYKVSVVRVQWVGTHAEYDKRNERRDRG